MCRGRIIGGFLVVMTALFLGLAVSPHSASAASPREICTDLADGHLDSTYSSADIAAYQQALLHDPTIQGYCGSMVPVCTYVDSNGQTVIAPVGSAACTPTQQTCTYTNSVGQSATAPLGSPLCATSAPVCVYTNASGQTVTVPLGSAECAPPNVCVYTGADNQSHTAPTGSPECAPKQTVTPPPPPTAGVAGVRHTQTPPQPVATTKPVAQVAGMQKTKTAPSPTAAAPLAATQSSGSLPFTGAQLAIFAIVGAALLGGGLLLRLTARQKKSGI